jgi:hypothetical protein
MASNRIDAIAYLRTSSATNAGPDKDSDMRAISPQRARRVYQVTKQLPHNGREFEYHIKSANEEQSAGSAGKRTDQGVGVKEPLHWGNRLLCPVFASMSSRAGASRYGA